ncbi:hypothetical protein [Arthrobacter sp. DR-2P]|nr:hypothetical protein [Arthrobacter sp. DR-2P]
MITVRTNDVSEQPDRKVILRDHITTSINLAAARTTEQINGPEIRLYLVTHIEI